MKNIWQKGMVSVAVAAMFAIPACESKPGDSGYEIVLKREKVQPEPEQEGVYDDPRDVVAHIFMDVEGTDWMPLSYEDAERGVLSDTVGEVDMTLDADAVFEQEEDGRIVLGNLQGERRHYIVVCDREDTIYAWRELKTVGDAGTIYLNLYFRPWREPKPTARTYSEAGWTIANKYVEPEPEEGGDVV